MSTKVKFTAISAVILSVWSGSAAANNLVQNGGFETTTLASPGLAAAGTVANWSVGFGVTLWFPGTADSPTNASAVWGPGDGSANGLPATSPDGGNFLEQDANYLTTAFSQTIGGLTPGGRYLLDFDWAAGQWRYSSNTATTNQWFATLGAQTQQTAVVSLPYAGFSPWRHEQFVYTPAAAVEVLSFISSGSGDPPLAFLDGVSLTAIPEPASWTMMLLGVFALGLRARLAKPPRAPALR